MSWPMAPAGQWNSAFAQMPDMNMAAYTPEQWAAMQQQNWQQWTQWQQQYTQWQTQYGEKYTEQMRAMQAAGAMPTFPTASIVPPPPPDKPPQPPQPPPPPHENNQPLYGTPQVLPIPVPPPTQKQPKNTNSGNNNNMQIAMTNNQSLSHPIENTGQVNQPIVNAEALKKLAEEERLFDIQFQKWEEEIEKWKRENVNHPDKQAYNEYEQKFETCRAQLLERRQQMKQKRARLLGNVPQAVNTPVYPQAVNTQGNMCTTIPPPLQIKSDNYNQNVQSQNYNRNNSAVNSVPYQQYKDRNQSSYNRSSNKNIDPQDRYESYQNVEDYSTTIQEGPNFLPTGSSSKGIPGLDLVPDAEKTMSADKPEVIDITDEKSDNALSKKPDYSTISKGINNILGDEKIMNILSMVRGQNTNTHESGNQNTSPVSAQHTSNNDYNILQNVSQNNQWTKNNNSYNNQQHVNRQNTQLIKHDPNNYPMQQGQDQNTKFPMQSRMYDNRQGDGMQEQYYDRNTQYRGPNVPPRPPQGPLLMRTDIPPPNRPDRPPLQDMTRQQNMNAYSGGPHESRNMHDNEQPPKLKWVDEPMFTPSVIVEYEHKPLRLKARDFIEPVHMFDYNHKSKDEEYAKRDFEKEAEDLFVRKPRRTEAEGEFDSDRFSRDLFYRDHERRMSREELREDYRKVPPRDPYERRRAADRYDDRKLDDRDRYSRREDIYRERDREREDIYRERDRERDREKDMHRDREKDIYRDRERDIYRDRDSHRDRYRDYRREEIRNRSRSRDRELRKRGRSRESEVSNNSSKRSREQDNTPNTAKNEAAKHIVMIDDLLEPPGRHMRPEKIAIILRGPPGSGKSYLAKLIRDKEAEHGGTSRILSIDDYFMQEGEIEEKDPNTGKIIKKPSLKYEYDEKLEETYLNSLKRQFKRTLTDGYFSFLIYDAVNDQLKSYADIWNISRQNGFQVYICTMELDPQICFKRNIHNRSLEDIEVICSRFFSTPVHHIQLDATTLLQNAAIPEVQMEDAMEEVTMEDAQETEVESNFTSKWERMDDAAQLARLDGTNKPLRSSQLSMEDYLQLDDWKPNTAKPGKKTVRWADIEERRQQEKMRAIGFVVGQTDWNRMTDPTMGSSALTQTKYIERVRRGYDYN